MLDEFRLVIREHWNALKEKPLSATLSRSEIEDETLTPPLYKSVLELSTEQILASFTVWGGGEIQIIIMDREKGEEILVDERRLNDPNEVRNIITDYFQQVRHGRSLEKP